MKKKLHIPVLLSEVVEEVISYDNSLYIDGTFGDGGHSEAIFEKIQNSHNSALVGFDFDTSGLEATTLKKITVLDDLVVPENDEYNVECYFVKSNFTKAPELISRSEYEPKLILLDLGVSSRQLEISEGFSFMRKEILDMRMGKDQEVKGYSLLNVLKEKQLLSLFTDEFVKVPMSLAKKLVSAIVEERSKRPFGDKADVERLNFITSKIMPIRRGTRGRLHPSTLVFLALRNAVNTEGYNLRSLLPELTPYLNNNMKLVIITYHSGERNIVDSFLNSEEFPFKIVKPTRDEITRNSRARSAIMYVISKEL